MTRAEFRKGMRELCESGLLTCTRGRAGENGATYALAWLPLDDEEAYPPEVRDRDRHGQSGRATEFLEAGNRAYPTADCTTSFVVQSRQRAKRWLTGEQVSLKYLYSGKIGNAPVSNIINLRSRLSAAPVLVNGKVGPPRLRKNSEVRTREHLEESEVQKLQDAARQNGRHGLRDQTLVHMAYRHGLRVSELVNLKWEQFDRKQGLLHIRRLKNGTPSTHTVEGEELRLLSRLRTAQEAAGQQSPFIFTSERGGPMTDSNVRKLIARLGVIAGIPFPVHPHQLRHACGYSMAKNSDITMRQIQHYLGHRNITHTVRYTELSPNALKGVGPS